MAFNFGAFVGGFSKQLVSDLETEEERKFEMEKIAQTEAMRQRAAASSRRRSEQLATEKMMGALSMFYGPDVAAQIAQRGETAADFAMTAGQKATERGLDPNALWRMPTTNGDMSDSSTQEVFDETINVAQAPDAPITAGVEGEGAPAPTITTGSFSLNREIFAQVYGVPNELANSYGTAIARLSQRILRTTDEAEIARLEAERTALVEDYSEFETAGRAPGQEENSVFNFGTLPAAVSAELRNARNRYGFETDMQGNITNMREGTEHKSYIAELSAAQALEATYGPLNDRAMNDRIGDMRNQANRDLIEYGRRVMAGGNQGTGGRRLKAEPDISTFSTNLVSGQYRVGDVITYRDDNGNLMFAIYTGLPNRDGLPIIYGQ